MSSRRSLPDLFRDLVFPLCTCLRQSISIPSSSSRHRSASSFHGFPARFLLAFATLIFPFVLVCTSINIYPLFVVLSSLCVFVRGIPARSRRSKIREVHTFFRGFTKHLHNLLLFLVPRPSIPHPLLPVSPPRSYRAPDDPINDKESKSSWINSFRRRLVRAKRVVISVLRDIPVPIAHQPSIPRIAEIDKENLRGGVGRKTHRTQGNA